ncbi:MAG: hypothetical protein H7A21_01950 [Spirochaetales bacterium]|nr:hypothetical protein [Leptospiraceae bacterium]MCP5480169.1 hypothetical protein [Spirochaetales bacterium]MCP5485491.1 hypothetical protein [Spirochaetales bacterium]
MNFFCNSRIRLLAPALILLLTAPHCALFGRSEGHAIDALRAFLNLIDAGDARRAYLLLSPEFHRNTSYLDFKGYVAFRAQRLGTVEERLADLEYDSDLRLFGESDYFLRARINTRSPNAKVSEHVLVVYAENGFRIETYRIGSWDEDIGEEQSYDFSENDASRALVSEIDSVLDRAANEALIYEGLAIQKIRLTAGPEPEVASRFLNAWRARDLAAIRALSLYPVSPALLEYALIQAEYQGSQNTADSEIARYIPVSYYYRATVRTGAGPREGILILYAREAEADQLTAMDMRLMDFDFNDEYSIVHKQTYLEIAEQAEAELRDNG